MLTKTQGKRYAYRYNFRALKLACEAQQNPMPSDTKEDRLHAIMQTAISDSPGMTQSPSHSDTREEYTLPSHSNSFSDTREEYILSSLASPATTEYSEASSQARTPPPPYPDSLDTFNTLASYHSEEYLSPDSSYDYSDLSLPSSELVSALVCQSPPLPHYQELSTGSWATTGHHFSASDLEFNLNFLERPASQ